MRTASFLPPQRFYFALVMFWRLSKGGLVSVAVNGRGCEGREGTAGISTGNQSVCHPAR